MALLFPWCLLQATPHSLQVHVCTQPAELGAWCEGLIDALAERYYGVQGFHVEAQPAAHDSEPDSTSVGGQRVALEVSAATATSAGVPCARMYARDAQIL